MKLKHSRCDTLFAINSRCDTLLCNKPARHYLKSKKDANGKDRLTAKCCEHTEETTKAWGDRVVIQCAWCDNLKEPALRGYAPDTKVIAHVCSVKCAEQWNRWCRNKSYKLYSFQQLSTGRWIKIKKLELDQIDNRE